MSRRLALPLLCLNGFFLLSGCGGPPPDEGQIDRRALEAEVTASSDAFWEAWRGGRSGLDRALAFFDDHPDFAYAAGGTVWRSLPDLTNTFRTAFQVVQSQAIEIQETVTTIVGRDAVHLMQRGNYSITDTDGVTSEEIPFAFSGLWVRTDDGWRVRCAHESEPGVG
jgi:hypothetical protein